MDPAFGSGAPMSSDASIAGAEHLLCNYRGSIGVNGERKFALQMFHPVGSAFGNSVTAANIPGANDREDISGIIRLHRIENDLPSGILRKVFRDLKTKDTLLYAHGQRVALYSMMIGERLGLAEDRLFTLGVAAWLHDIGKLHVPKSIHYKEVRLTSSEWDIMRRHADFGHSILTAMGADVYARVAFGHHERHDGKGYHRIKSYRLGLETQITSAADAYDAITSRRCYRNNASHRHAMDELTNCAGTQFSPTVVEAAEGIASVLDRIRSWAWKDNGSWTDETDLSDRIGALLAG
jgi:HD-GYP domain-containing protein (c-di-GMP phosphodiesterase class II)